MNAEKSALQIITKLKPREFAQPNVKKNAILAAYFMTIAPLAMILDTEKTAYVQMVISSNQELPHAFSAIINVLNVKVIMNLRKVV